MLVDRFCLLVTLISTCLFCFLHVQMSHTKTGGNIAVRARGSTGCTTSSSSSVLPEVRFELERNRLAELSVRVRCIFRFAEVILLRWRTEAWIHVRHANPLQVS